MAALRGGRADGPDAETTAWLEAALAEGVAPGEPHGSEPTL